MLTMLPRVAARQIALSILFVLGLVRFAAADEARDAAGAHYARGLELAKNGNYEAALQEFNAAYAISPQFSVLYNIGQAQIALDHPSQAIELFARYLSEGKGRIPEPRRQRVETLISSLSSRLATLSITADRPNAQINVDGGDVGATPLAEPLRLDAGTHTVLAKVEGIPVLIRIVVLREAEHQTLDLELPAPSSKAAAAAAREAVAKAMAAAAAAARAADEAQVASRVATAAAEREKSIAATRAASYSAARAATAQAQHQAAEAAARGRATPGGGGR
jgi:tetratricopeptide (TPR) repeat protein